MITIDFVQIIYCNVRTRGIINMYLAVIIQKYTQLVIQPRGSRPSDVARPPLNKF